MLKQIFNDLDEKINHQEIQNKYNLSFSSFKKMLKEYKKYKKFMKKEFIKQVSFKIDTPPCFFGHKKESYYSEEDMLKGTAQLIKEDLNKRLGQAS